MPLYSQAEKGRFLDDLDKVAITGTHVRKLINSRSDQLPSFTFNDERSLQIGSNGDVRSFCQAASPRKPPTKFARDLHCKQMLIEYETAFVHLLDSADDDELLMQFVSK